MEIAIILYMGIALFYLTMKAEKKIGEVRVRASSNARGASLEVTIPKEVLLFLQLRKGDVMEVYVDEENRKIIYCLSRGI